MGLSTLPISVMALDTGTAATAVANWADLQCIRPGDLNQLHSTYAVSAYNAEYRGTFQRKTVPYMNEAAISQALWQQLQQQLQALEVRLAQIADLSDPPKGLDAWCNGCCAFDKTKINAFKAVAAQIKATRDVHMASVNVQLDGIALPRSRSVHNVRLCFGGGNSAYYLDAVPRPQGYSAAQVLQEAQAAEQAARSARAWAGDIELPTTAAVTPANAAVGQQLMMVQVPAGLSGGQPLQVQTPAGVMAVQIPQGLTAGQSFQIQVPQAVQPPVMGQPVMGQPAAQPVAPMAPATLQMDHAWGVSSA